MQLYYGQLKCWTQVEKTFQLDFFISLQLLIFISKSGIYLRNKQNLILPRVSTIKKWIGGSKCMPSFNISFLKQFN